MSAHVFIANLNYNEVDESKLFALFSRFIDVRSVKIVTDDAGRSRGFAFLELLHPEDLQAALELNNYVIAGRPMHVAAAKRK